MKPILSPDPLRILRPILLVAVAVGLALALAGPGSAVAQEGALAVDCEGSTLQVEAECQFGEEQMFTVVVHATSVPAAGYVAFQAKLRWDDAVLDYRPSAEVDQEAAWPDCGIPARRDNRPGDASVLLGCVTFPPEPSSHTGPLLQLTFACIGAGTSQLTLVARAGDVQDGSHFIELDSEGAQTLIDPSLTRASVTCEGQAVDRPTAEPTLQPPGPTAPADASTETPQAVGITEQTATAVGITEQTATSEAATLPFTGTTDVADADSGGGPAGWVLIVVAILAGGAGVSILAWRRLARR